MNLRFLSTMPGIKTGQKIKRFYKKATIVETDRGLYNVKLDKRTLKTPELNVLELPTLPLALAVAAEW